MIRYPRWRFDAANSAPFGAIKKLNEIFGEAGLDPWTLAAFVTAPQPELGDRTPVDAFADADPEPLLLSARRTVASSPMASGRGNARRPGWEHGLDSKW